MAKAEPIDIYEELKTEELTDILSMENDALYDDVVTGSVGSERPLKTETTKDDDQPEVLYTYKGCTADKFKRFSVYVGNFSWWTSDKDLLSVARTLGVKDVLDIKFAENRANGQSRGFAEIVVSTEESVKRLIDSIPHCQINGEKVQCRYATRQNLAVFEDQAKKRIPQRSNSKSDSEKADNRSSISSPTDVQLPLLPPMFPPPPQMVKPPSLLPNFFNPPPLPFPPPHLQPPPLPHLFPPPSPHMPNTHIPPPHMPNTHVPSLHINPAFFPPHHETHNSSTGYGRHSVEVDVPSPDGEFEELMNRNRTIASSAITKAISGATTGDVSMAIETLLTAIAVIKQSRVYSDDRCRALVESLKDCLYSIESKSYGSRKRHRSRERDREHMRSRERERERERDRESSYGQAWPEEGPSRRHRERSSSVERERDRGRERHREHRERHR